MSRQIAVIKHTAEYRGDHATDYSMVYLFPETATLADVLSKIDAKCGMKEWFEIPPAPPESEVKST